MAAFCQLCKYFVSLQRWGIEHSCCWPAKKQPWSIANKQRLKLWSIKTVCNAKTSLDTCATVHTEACNKLVQHKTIHAYWLHAARVGIGDKPLWSVLHAETLLCHTAFKPTHLMILNVVSQASTYNQDPFAGCCWFLLRTQDSAASKFLNWAFWPLMTACCATVLLGVGWGIAVAFSVE